MFQRRQQKSPKLLVNWWNSPLWTICERKTERSFSWKKGIGICGVCIDPLVTSGLGAGHSKRVTIYNGKRRVRKRSLEERLLLWQIILSYCISFGIAVAGGASWNGRWMLNGESRCFNVSLLLKQLHALILNVNFLLFNLGLLFWSASLQKRCLTVFKSREPSLTSLKVNLIEWVFDIK